MSYELIDGGNIPVPMTSLCIQDGVSYVSLSYQQTMVIDRGLLCLQHVQQETRVPGMCPTTWDGVMCWPQSHANSIVSQPCPYYINNFFVDANASRVCEADGSWLVANNISHGWTNYTQCYSHENDSQTIPTVSPLIGEHVSIISTISVVGYSISCLSLTAALIIMLHIRSLRGQAKNVIHINLFLAFLLRAIISLLKQALIIDGLGLRGDLYTDTMGNFHFCHQGPHWECRCLFVIYNYVLFASCSWVFMEGLYLHNILFLTFTHQPLPAYIIFGWGFPLLFVIPWALVRLTLENVLCWNTHPTPALYQIIKAPQTLTVLINFLLFIRVLCQLAKQMRDITRYSINPSISSHWSMIKSTLVLIPLFGVHYIVFIVFPIHFINNPAAELTKLYFEVTFNSFQGLLLACLYCFANHEVKAEVSRTSLQNSLSRVQICCHFVSRRPSTATVSSHVTLTRQQPSSSYHADDVARVRDETVELQPLQSTVHEQMDTELNE